LGAIIGAILNAIGGLWLAWLRQKDAEIAEAKAGEEKVIADENKTAAETSDAMAQVAAQHPTDDSTTGRLRDGSF